jgi:hypothetical protein
MANSEEDIPLFFVDRSLGKSIVVELRKAGLEVLSMADVYGEQAGQGLADETWLADAGKNNWVVLTKDDAIRRRPAERDALIEANVRVFCLTNRNLRAKEQAQRFVMNAERMLRRATTQGPYIYGVYDSGLRRLWP